jgi:hypothetical protein
VCVYRGLGEQRASVLSSAAQRVVSTSEVTNEMSSWSTHVFGIWTYIVLPQSPELTVMVS